MQFFSKQGLLQFLSFCFHFYQVVVSFMKKLIQTQNLNLIIELATPENDPKRLG